MANAQLDFSPGARRDLLLIDSRSAHERGVDRANRYLRSLNQACDRLAKFPDIGAGAALTWATSAPSPSNST